MVPSHFEMLPKPTAGPQQKAVDARTHSEPPTLRETRSGFFRKSADGQSGAPDAVHLDSKPLSGGTEESRRYYDTVGWREGQGGELHDFELWGGRSGPIRAQAGEVRSRRIYDKLSRLSPMSLLECGCGGNPELALLPLCRKYTAIDFSRAGLKEAALRLEDSNKPHEVVEGDICNMPFADGEFDGVYTANALYHIKEEAEQARALSEIVRVTRPGGTVAIVYANSRPWLFWGRMLRRLIADTPGIGPLADGLRKDPPIPYNARPLSWMRQQLEPHGKVEIVTHTIPSVWFNQNVSEDGTLGKITWDAIRRIEERYPKGSAQLGCFVQIFLEKS